MAGDLTIEEAAERLGLHYMTVYRYIRTGRLPAHRRGGRWLIREGDVSRLSTAPAAGPHRRSRRRASSESLMARMLEGDGRGAWALVEEMLLAGSPRDVYLHGLAPALRRIGDAWATGDLSVADEHRATAVALGLVGRLGPSFQRRGRHRAARVLLAGAEGDSHSIPLIIVGDVLRADGFDLVQLGADVPVEEVTRTAASIDGLRLVGLSAATDHSARRLRGAVDQLRAQVPHAAVLVGGPAVDSDTASRLRADGWAPDAAGALEQARRLLAPAQTGPGPRAGGSRA